jgi:ABC-type antimicrobial peptide transport system permease subunit
LPAQSLRGVSGHKGNGKGYLWRGLIVFQFAISLVFIIGTLVIGNQIRFMRKELSFTNGAIISLWGGERKNASVLAEKIKQLAGVNRVALQGFPPVGMARAIRPVRNQGKDQSYIGVSIKVGNEDFIPFYEMKLLAGRNLQQTDSIKEFVINRSYSKFLGFTKPTEALGQLIYWEADPYPVVGVVEDFHEGSFHELIAPIAITNNPQEENNIVIKLGIPGKQATDIQALLSQVENQWKQVYPDQPFNFSFLDDDIAMLFEKEQRAGILMNAVMMITIFISCMGVFGLAMFSAQIRTKEIGIRKVLGATVANITAMLSKEFVLLVLIATIISSPIAWYFMDQWLQDFAYRIQISWWVFAVAGLAAMAIALATVSFQAIKAARANPIDSLRTE